MDQIDLNLLRVFETLFEQRSVTRAADRLGLTQSAVSHALGRLRHMIGDPLFLRGQGGLLPTARAEEMAPRVHEGLLRLRAAVAPPEAEDGPPARRFTIAAGAYFCAIFIPALIERSRREAPLVSFRIVPLSDTILALLDRDRADLALGAFSGLPGRFAIDALYDEAMAWVAALDNPLSTGPVERAAVEAAPRIAIVPGTSLHSGGPGTDTDLQPLMPPFETGTGSGAIAVYDSATAIAIAARTEMVAFVPRRAAQFAAARGEVAILNTPPADFAAPLAMLWHVRHREDRGHAWLRSLVHAIVGGAG